MKNDKPSDAIDRPIWLVLWLVLIGLGFIYVSTILCRRPNPLQSGNNPLLDFVALIGVSAFLYQWGPAINWPPRSASFRSIFLWNGMGYGVPFFVALHWELLSQAVDADFSLKSSDLKQLDAGETLIVILIGGAVLLLLAWHIRWAVHSKSLPSYLVWLIGVPACVTLFVAWRGNEGYLHVHHYCFAAYLVPLFQFKTPISLISQGFFLGLLVEGVARWGIDPLWYSC